MMTLQQPTSLYGCLLHSFSSTRERVYNIVRKNTSSI